MQVEVRQPFFMPAVFNVPEGWVGLSKRRKRIKELKIQARDSEAAAVLLEHATSEFDQLIDQCGFNLWRRDMLRQELAKATSGPVTIRAYLPGEPTTRPKLEVLSDLVECANWLASISGDPSLAAEATELSNKLSQAWLEAEA